MKGCIRVGLTDEEMALCRNFGMENKSLPMDKESSL